MVTFPAVGVEHFLQFGEAFAALGGDLLGVLAVTGEARTGVGVDVADQGAGAEAGVRRKVCASTATPQP